MSESGLLDSQVIICGLDHFGRCLIANISLTHPSSLFQSTVKTKRDTVKGYFLAGGDMVWWPVSSLWFN